MRSRVKSKQEKRRTVIKWMIYSLMIALAYVLMTTIHGSFPTPLLLMAIPICISAWESEMTSAVTGGVCGLMLDSACGKLIGFNGIIVMCMCMVISLLFIHYLRKNLLNILLIGAAALLLHSGLDFLFFYAIWGESGKIYSSIMLPSMIATMVSIGLIYEFVKLLANRFGLIEEYYLEEKNENIIRE